MIISRVLNKSKFILGAAAAFLISCILQINLIIPLFLLSLVIYLRFASGNLRLQNYNLLHLVFLFVIIFVITHIVVKQGLPVYSIPFCAIPMLSAILFNELGLALLLTIAYSFTAAAIASGDLYSGLLFLLSGLVSGILVFDARRRMVVIRAGFLAGILQAISLFFIERFSARQPNAYAYLLVNGIVSGVIVLGVLPVFEYLFKTATNISLLELADFNHPLMQRMMTEAPGTYHHSLIVGNLSEAACQAVGAHALLARIGAYYHDIGKLKKPEYFSENQEMKDSKHEALSPTMSKMIIMNHVKEGIELAKKYRLNPRLMDFILQHHGTSLVYYFYRRALEELEEDQHIKEEGFRYSGPKPRTKENAVVLLADSVEAAARALREPAPKKIEEVVHKVINNKFIDGQLDECDLTLNELEKIAAVFIRILSGIYHSRVTYPEKSEK